MNFKNKIEEKFKSNDMKSVWKDMKTIAGFDNKSTKMTFEKGSENEYTNDLNQFYARFDNQDFSVEIDELKERLSTKEATPIVVYPVTVTKTFNTLKCGKACGPDGISSTLLKTCAHELSYIYSEIYNKSLNTGNILPIW